MAQVGSLLGAAFAAVVTFVEVCSHRHEETFFVANMKLKK
jgi:hypothetical protein